MAVTLQRERYPLPQQPGAHAGLRGVNRRQQAAGTLVAAKGPRDFQRAQRHAVEHHVVAPVESAELADMAESGFLGLPQVLDYCPTCRHGGRVAVGFYFDKVFRLWFDKRYFVLACGE